MSCIQKACHACALTTSHINIIWSMCQLESAETTFMLDVMQAELGGENMWSVNRLKRRCALAYTNPNLHVLCPAASADVIRNMVLLLVPYALHCPAARY